jgi:hypothetical protein
MRKFIMAATAIAALAVPAIVPAVSLANASGADQTLSSSLGVIGSPQGNAKNTTTQYKTTYTDPVNGPVSCSGVHKSGSNQTTNGSDSWTCTSTTGSPLLNATPGTTVDESWISDYWNMKSPGTGGVVTAHLTFSADGMSETGVASYN